MNKIKFLSFLVGCLAVFSFSACNDDDDDNGLTPAEKQQCFSIVGGSYSGQMIYYNENKDNVNDVTDTISIAWNIRSDSTMTIYDFPVSLLAQHVSNDQLKEALENASPINIDCVIDFASVSPVAFFVSPITPSLTLTYGGQQHRVQVVFYVNNSYSFGQYAPSNKILQMQIIAAAIWVDGVQTTYLSNSTAYLFLANR